MKTQYRHKQPIQLRFNDVDLFGHVNNAIYLQYLDLGKLMYFRQFAMGNFGAEPTAPVVANVNIDFVDPIHPADEIAVETAVTAIGETSLTLSQRITDAAGSVKCRATTVMVNVGIKTGQPEPVPTHWRTELSRFEDTCF